MESPVCSSWFLLVTVMEGNPLRMVSPQQQCEKSLCEAGCWRLSQEFGASVAGNQ